MSFTKPPTRSTPAADFGIPLCSGSESKDILNEYWLSIGGEATLREEQEKARNASRTARKGGSSSAAGKKRGRPSSGAETTVVPKRTKAASGGGGGSRSRHPADSTPPASAAEDTWRPPAGSWEDDIETVDVYKDTEMGRLVVCFTWKSGRKTQHDTQVAYKRAPQKVRRALSPPNTLRNAGGARHGGSNPNLSETTQILQYYERHITIRGEQD